MHIESFMIPPFIFSGAAPYYGITTVVADFHEFTTVLGKAKIEPFMQEKST